MSDDYSTEILMTHSRKSHPSGRPIRHREVKGRSIWRIPDTGPVTPGLQKQNDSIGAIGFTAEIGGDELESQYQRLNFGRLD